MMPQIVTVLNRECLRLPQSVDFPNCLRQLDVKALFYLLKLIFRLFPCGMINQKCHVDQTAHKRHKFHGCRTSAVKNVGIHPRTVVKQIIYCRHQTKDTLTFDRTGRKRTYDRRKKVVQKQQKQHGHGKQGEPAPQFTAQICRQNGYQRPEPLSGHQPQQKKQGKMGSSSQNARRIIRYHPHFSDTF